MALGNREVGIELRARDMASQSLAAVGSSLGSVGDKAESTGGKFGALGKVVGTVGQGMQLAFGFSVAGKIAQGFNWVKSSIIDYNSTLQNSTEAMIALTKDAGGVKTMISQLTDIANKSPFEMPGLLKSTQMLVGLKFNMKDIPSMMTDIGDTAAAIGGGDVMGKIQQLTGGFVRMKAAGRVTGEVMEVMRNSGVPALDWLAKGFNVTSLEMQKMITKGVVPADKAMKVLLAGMRSNYGGQAIAQAKTFTGAMSTISDAGKSVVATMFKPLFEVITKVAYALGNFISSKGMTDFANNFSVAFGGVVKIAESGFTTLVNLFKAIREGANPLRVASDLMYGLRIRGFAGLRDILAGLEDKFLMFISKFDALRPAIAPLILAFDTFGKVLSTFGGVGLDAFTSIDPMLDKVTDSFARAGAVFREVAFDKAAGVLNDLSIKVGLLKDRFAPLAPVIAPVAAMLQGIADAAAAIAAGDFAAAFDGLGAALGSYADILPGVATAFDNWLTDMTPKIEEFVGKAVKWLGDSLPSVLDKITPIVQGMVEKFGVILPQLAGMVISWGEKLIDWISPMIPPMLAALSDWAQKMFAWLLTQLPVWADKLMALGTQLIGWITDSIPGMITAISGWAQSLFDWLINTGVPQAAAAIGPLALKFVDWVFEMLPKLLDALDQIIGAIINFIVTNGPTLIGKLLEWAIAFVGWIATEVIPRLVANLPTILRTLLLFLGGAAGKLVGKMGEIGGSMIGRFMGFLGKLPGRVGGLLGELPGKIGSFLGTVGKAAGDLGGKLIGGVVDIVKNLPGKVGGFLLDIIKTVVGFYARMLNTGKTIAVNFVKGIIDNLTSLPGKIFDMLSRLIKNVFKQGIDIGPLRIDASGIFLMGNKVASFAVGAWDIPKDMPAVVHEGEMIIPASIAGAIRKLAAGGPAPRTMPFPTATAGLATAAASGGAGGSLTIINNFGRDSVRSDDDISRISKEMAMQARMQGLTPTLRAIGTNT